jgi:pimeloyl-ACP methyl ester carboxylesterase
MNADPVTPNDTAVRVILIHGMGRTPLSMLILAARLRAAGLHPLLFGYLAAFERWHTCLARLQQFITRKTRGQRYIVIGHSLGCVLTRAVLPRLAQQPEACFFLAPPMQASRMARTFSSWRLFRLMTGEMGQLLAQQDWIDQLPMPTIPTTIYAGTAGPRGRWSPFGDEPNDGILTVAETRLASIPLITVPSIHTTIMNSRRICDDIVAAVNRLN